MVAGEALAGELVAAPLPVRLLLLRALPLAARVRRMLPLVLLLVLLVLRPPVLARQVLPPLAILQQAAAQGLAVAAVGAPVVAAVSFSLPPTGRWLMSSSSRPLRRPPPSKATPRSFLKSNTPCGLMPVPALLP